MLVRDKRTVRRILTGEGYQDIKRYRLYAVNTEEYPDSVKNCIAYYGTSSVYPMDMYLGIDKLPFKCTASVALRIAKIGITSPSYKEATARYYEAYKILLSDNMIREICDYIGEIVLENDICHTKEAVSHYNYSEIRIAKPGRRPTYGYILYVQADGAMFNTRPYSLLKDREDNRDESTWKENKLGLVFRSDELIQTNEKDEDGRPVMRLGEREYICTTRGIEVFRERLLYIMLKNGLADASDVVLLSDGAPWIRKLKELFFKNATQILDLYHLKENVMSFGQHIFNNKKSSYYPWWKQVCKQLEEGQWREVLKRPEIKEYDTQKSTPRGTVNLYHYIWNNRHFIDYPKYKAKGYFVGSGAIESGNKTVMQERLKLAGMRWYLNSAETLLALRAKHKSDLWESEVIPLVLKEYTQHHVKEGNVREKQREIHRKS